MLINLSENDKALLLDILVELRGCNDDYEECPVAHLEGCKQCWEKWFERRGPTHSDNIHNIPDFIADLFKN